MIKTRSAATALNKHKALQQFFKWLMVDEKEIDQSPMTLRPFGCRAVAATTSPVRLASTMGTLGGFIEPEIYLQPHLDPSSRRLLANSAERKAGPSTRPVYADGDLREHARACTHGRPRSGEPPLTSQQIG